DSSDTVRIVSEQARKAGYPLRSVHIPKTIDNDLVGNDHTPGFPSAARFVMQAFAGANLDNAALPGVYLAVVMGRHAGFLTAASACAKKYADDGPHLIYVPERSFEIERFLADVKAAYDAHGRCVIAVSEGIHDAGGTAIAAKLAKEVEVDAHGNVQLSGTGALADLLCEEIKTKLKIKRVRGDTFGYLQRSFAGCVSDVDQREAREVGEKAVQFALSGERDGSVAIQRGGAARHWPGKLPAVAAAYCRRHRVTGGRGGRPEASGTRSRSPVTRPGDCHDVPPPCRRCRVRAAERCLLLRLQPAARRQRLR